VELTEDEIFDYEKLSKKIGVLMNMGIDPDDDEKLLKLLLRRSKILQTAENKIPTTLNIIDSMNNLSQLIRKKFSRSLHIFTVTLPQKTDVK